MKRAVFCLSGKAGLSAEGGLLGKRRAIMANYIIYPNPAFQPRTDYLTDGTLVAHDVISDLWATRSGLIYRRETDGTWTRKHLIGCTPIVPTPNRHSQYPLVRVDGHRSPVTVHSVVARAWIGDRPPIRDTYGNILGYMEIDHLNGNIHDCSADNLQYVTPSENRRRARILRSLRAQALATNCPDLLPQNMRPDDLLALFTQNNLAGDCYEGV